MIELIREEQFKARIRVIGIGGCGNNAVNTMVEERIRGVEFIAMNTDIQVLKQCRAEEVIQIGEKLTRGLGAGGNPEVGREAAIESMEKIRETVSGADMIFIAAGMGGGTGTGAAPVVAELAKEEGTLVVGVVTKPFAGEGTHRNEIAQRGIEELKRYVDALIVINNDRLISMNKTQTAKESLLLGTQPLAQAVKGIAEIITVPGLINVDFADVREVMKETGMAVMGSAEASGEDRAMTARNNAINNPLLEYSGISGARGVLVNVTGNDVTLPEFNDIVASIQEEADPEARIISGLVIDETLDNRVRVTVIATGFGRKKRTASRSVRSEIKEILNNDTGATDSLEIPAFQRRSILNHKIRHHRAPVHNDVDPMAIAMRVFKNEPES